MGSIGKKLGINLPKSMRFGSKKTQEEIQTETCIKFVNYVLDYVKDTSDWKHEPVLGQAFEFVDCILEEFTPAVVSWRKARSNEERNNALKILTDRFGATWQKIDSLKDLPQYVRNVFNTFTTAGQFDDNEFELAAKIITKSVKVRDKIKLAFDNMDGKEGPDVTALKKEVQSLVHARTPEIIRFYANHDNVACSTAQEKMANVDWVLSDIFVRGLIGKRFDEPISLQKQDVPFLDL